MDPQTNKATVTAYVKAFNAGDFERLRSLFTPDAQIWGVAGAGSLEVAMPIWQALHSGLRMTLEVVDLCAEGDTVAARYVERGTWVGPFLGRDNPTGRSYELTAMEWFQFEGGLIKARWGARDSATQQRQLGMT